MANAGWVLQKYFGISPRGKQDAAVRPCLHREGDNVPRANMGAALQVGVRNFHTRQDFNFAAFHNLGIARALVIMALQM